jgi:cobalt-zinc-cadmium efflux system membrane fusion protein
MFATVELALAADAPPVIAIPEDSLQDLDGKKVVFVAENEAEFGARLVQTGRSTGGMIEIVSGLKEGERYAVKGAFILKSELKKGEVVDEHGHGK